MKRNAQTWLSLLSWIAAVAVAGASGALAAEDAKPDCRVEFKRNDAAGQMQVLIDGKEAMVYCHGDDVDLPHYYPVRSPSGKSLTVQQANPYPHHRSVWFADTVHLDRRGGASFYNALYSRVDKKDPKSPFRTRIRQVEFTPGPCAGAQGEMTLKLCWEHDQQPVLDELREMRVVALGDGEYLLDLKFTVTAAYGDVHFTSDAVHYAWPYVRMDPQFSALKGARITTSEGDGRGRGNPARWVDFSNTVDGVAEGLALFSRCADGPPHWLIREYGTFGPRRPAEQNGKRFTVKKGDSLKQHVAILVHKGDAAAGRVAERYEQYVKGKL